MVASAHAQLQRGRGAALRTQADQGGEEGGGRAQEGGARRAQSRVSSAWIRQSLWTVYDSPCESVVRFPPPNETVFAVTTVLRAVAALRQQPPERMASIECYVCSDALSHDHGGVRCTSDPPHHICTGDTPDCAKEFCSSRMNELSADTFPPMCGMCSAPVTLASFDANLDATQRLLFLQVSLTHALAAESESTETIVRCPRTARTLRPAATRST